MSSAAPAVPSNELRDEVVLEAREVSKIYALGEVEVHALRRVSLSLIEGELMVLLGASGSGKSTLLNIIGGLDVPTSGRVLARDLELTDADDAALTTFRRENVGFVFQFYNLIPSLTALENVALVTDIALDPLEPEEALALVGLGDRLNHFPSQLSGGEQQRVAIARAVAKRPAILLCDEPTGALDSKTGTVVLRVLADVNRDLGTTTAVITHNASVGAMANRVVTLVDGEISQIKRNESVVSPEDITW